MAPIDDDVQAIIVWLGGIDDTKTFELINAVRTQKRGKMGSIHGRSLRFRLRTSGLLRIEGAHLLIARVQRGIARMVFHIGLIMDKLLLRQLRHCVL